MSYQSDFGKLIIKAGKAQAKLDELYQSNLVECHRLSCQDCKCGGEHKICHTNHTIRELELLQEKG